MNLLAQFSLGSKFEGFSATESREVSSKEKVYDFSVDLNSIINLDIFNIHKYLMTENNIK